MLQIQRVTTFAILMAMLALVAPAFAAEDATKSSDDAVKEALAALPSYEYGDSRAGLYLIETAVREAGANRRAKRTMAKSMAGVLKSKSTNAAKDFACRQLAIIGGESQVDAIANLLADKELSDIARYALERIEGEAAGAALIKALEAKDEGIRVGVINSLGARGEAASVPAVVKLTADKNEAVACAAIEALGAIDDAAASKALLSMVRPEDAAQRASWSRACLRCAEQLDEKAAAAAIYERLLEEKSSAVRAGAMAGMARTQGEKALPLLIEAIKGDDARQRAIAASLTVEIPGEETTKQLASQLSQLEPAAQQPLIVALAERGDLAAMRDVVGIAMRSEDEATRLVAIDALGKLGTGRTAMLLAMIASGDKKADADTARATFAMMPGADVDEEILKAVATVAEKPTTVSPERMAEIRATMRERRPTSTEERERIGAEMNAWIAAELAKAAAARNITAAASSLLTIAKASIGAASVEAIRALGEIGGKSQIKDLLALQTSGQPSSTRKEAGKAAVAIARRTEAGAGPTLAALRAAKDDDARASLMESLGAIGDDKALNALTKTATGDGTKDVRTAAVRALGGWQNASAIAPLQKIATTDSDVARKTLALRGFIRLAEQITDNAERLKAYEEAMALAARPDEKRLILGGLGKMRDVGALELATACLEDKAVQKEAALAIVAVAKSLGGKPKDKVDAAVQKAVEATGDKSLVDKAKGRKR